MPTDGVQQQVVQFRGVDWDNEESKSEHGHLQRKVQIIRRRKSKVFKKMAAAEMGSLKRFRRILHDSMNNNNELLQPLLPEHLVRNFFYNDEDDHQQNVIRLQRDLASEEDIILGNEQKRIALALLKITFIGRGHFGEAHDVLQTRLAIQELNQMLEKQQRALASIPPRGVV
jgi:hypothetical protein